MKKRTDELFLDEYFEYREFIELCKTKEYAVDDVLHSHHIIPKCLGGKDEDANLVKLSVEDHKLAHKLLAECFTQNSYEQIANLMSYNLLNRSIKSKEELNKHSEIYKGENNPFYGKNHSDESKKLISEATVRTRTGVGYDELYGDRSLEEKQKRSNGVKLAYSRMTEEQKLNKSLKLSKKTGIPSHNSIPVEFQGVKYRSIKEASEKTGISIYYVRKAINENTIGILG